MVNHTFEVKDFGKVTVTPLKFVEPEYPRVDAQGQPVTSKIIGKGSTHFYNAAGEEIPKDAVFNLINGKCIKNFKKTEYVATYQVLDEPGEIYDFLEHGTIHKAQVSLETAKFLDEGKTLKFGYVNGVGKKVWKGYLTSYQGVIMFFLGRGSMKKSLASCTDDAIELESGFEKLNEQELMAMAE